MPNSWTGAGNPYTRDEVIARLRDTLAKGESIIAAGAGTGISAKFIEEGGADLIIIYNSGRYRMMGHGSIAGMMGYGDANATAMEIGEFEVLPHREEEVETVALARKMDIFSIVYVASPEEAKAMAEAGADVIIAHVGCTVGGSIGVTTAAMTLHDAAKATQAIIDAGKTVRKDVIYLSHGGPIEFIVACANEKLPKQISKKVEAAISYFENNLDRMNYASYRKSHLPIGSGVTEAACKTVVKLRMCGSGMSWKKIGSDAVLTLRALALTNSRWAEFWQNTAKFGLANSKSL